MKCYIYTKYTQNVENRREKAYTLCCACRIYIDIYITIGIERPALVLPRGPNAISTRAFVGNFFLLSFVFRHGWTRYIKFRSVLNLFVGTQLQRPLFTRCAPKNTHTHTH